MSIKSVPSSLKSLQTDLTRQLLLKSALELMEDHSVIEVTARAVAKKAGISERTVFRYFSTRDELLDAVAAAVVEKLGAPPPPLTLEELLDFPEKLVNRFEENPNLTKAAIHSEIYDRIIGTAAKARWKAIQDLVSDHFPRCPKRQAKLVAANIRFLLGASTWHYYRFIFGFSAQETIDAIRTGIGDSIRGLQSYRKKG